MSETGKESRERSAQESMSVQKKERREWRHKRARKGGRE